MYERATGTAVAVGEGMNGLKLCVSHGCLHKRWKVILVTEGAKTVSYTHLMSWLIGPPVLTHEPQPPMSTASGTAASTSSRTERESSVCSDE